VADEKRSTHPPLTAAGIENLPEGEHRDSAAPGLFLRVNRKSRTFRWYVRSIGRAITVGPWSKTPKPGHVTLAEARAWLERLKDAHRSGQLAGVERELAALRPRRGVKSSAPPSDSGALTVETVGKDFLVYLEGRRRRPEQARRCLEVEVFPRIGHFEIAKVTKADVRAVVEPIVKRGSKVQAGQVLSLMRQFFAWAVDREDDLPMPGIPKADTVGARKAQKSDRYLTPEEIVAFWEALGSFKGITPTVRNALRLLLLLPVRSGELRKATWSELDLDAAVWTIPVEHQKRPQGPWKVPLPPMAVAIFRELRALADSLESENVLASFAGEGDAITDKALNHAVRRLFTGEKPALVFKGERPTPHDLRRTVRFHARQTLGVPFDVAEKLLGHSLGAIPGTYDPGDLFGERRAALEKWAAFVEQLVAPEKSKVVRLAKARRA
jgi:integrase